MDLLADHAGFGLVELSLEDLEAAGQRLEPSPTEDDPFHAEVIGDKKSAKRQLAKAARWIVEPPRS
jgi:hypothetical protein